MLLHLLAELESPIVYSQVTQFINTENENVFLDVPLPVNEASQSLGQMPVGDNGESSYRFQFNPGDWYQKKRQHNITGCNTMISLMSSSTVPSMDY